MEFNFSGQTVLVTGATRGLGKAIATQFEKLGADLIVTGTKAGAIKDKPLIKYFSVDFNQEKSVTQFLKKISLIKKIDVLINNAGVNKINFIDKTNIADWDRIMNINLKAPYRLIREIAPIMKKNRYGRIVNVSSIFGVISRAQRSHYSASKFGLHGLTTTASIELAGDGILVNTISPGFIDTDLTRSILSTKEISELKKNIPTGRLAQVDEIARTVVFLASQLNTYINGHNLVIDGGYINV